MTDYVEIPNESSGTAMTTISSAVKALDGTNRLLEVINPITRKVPIVVGLEAPYRTVSPVVVEKAGLTSLLATDAKLIDCVGFSEVTITAYTKEIPDNPESLSFMVVGYLLQDGATGTWAPVAFIDKDTTPFAVSHNSDFTHAVDVVLDGVSWYLNGRGLTVRVGAFEKVAAFIISMTATNLTEVALCYSLA